MQDSSVIIYIEQKEDQRVEITAGELAKTVVPRIVRTTLFIFRVNPPSPWWLRALI